jgi:hypothetical protein
MGHTEPPSFLAVTAELASIADAGEAWRGPRRSATSPRRQVLPYDRTPRLTGAAPALGHNRPSTKSPSLRFELSDARGIELAVGTEVDY